MTRPQFRFYACGVATFAVGVVFGITFESERVKTGVLFAAINAQIEFQKSLVRQLDSAIAALPAATPVVTAPAPPALPRVIGPHQ